MLKEFVVKVLEENNITSDADEIIKNITAIAKSRAQKGCAIISDDEVREMVINNADLANKAVEERRLKEERDAEAKRIKAEQDKVRKEEEQRKKAEEKMQKALEEERKTAAGEQQSLFGWIS